MGLLLTLHSPRQTIITGSVARAKYIINTSTYYIIGKDFIRDGIIQWNELYAHLYSNLRGNLNINLMNLISMAASETVKAHRLAVGTSVNHGIYAVMSAASDISVPLMMEDEEPEFSSLYNLLISSLESTFNASISLPIDVFPPNQEEHRLDPALLDGEEYFIPINPIRNTIRRTLSYANYILDGNSVMDADPGEGYRSAFSLNHWSANWFIGGELRRFFNWRRRRQGGLTYDDAPPCSNAEIGATSMSDWLVPTWKGFNTFRKNNNSTAWIPFELYTWPCASLQRFYSVASYIDKNMACDYRALPMGCLFPLMITSPIGAMGFQGFQHISNMASYCVSIEYYPLYGRPYADDSDGSGIWHGLT